MVLTAHNAGMDHAFRCFGAARCRRHLDFAAPMARLVVALRHDPFSGAERGGVLRLRPLPFSFSAIADALCWSRGRGTGQSVPDSKSPVVGCGFCGFARERADRELAIIWNSWTGSRRV